MNRYVAHCACSVLAMGVIWNSAAHAASGDPVTGYGQNGTVTLPSITNGSAQDVVVSSQVTSSGIGYVLRISIDQQSNTTYAIYRLTAAGAVDSSFAAGGIKITNTTGSYLRYQGLLVDESKQRFYLVGRNNIGPSIDARKFDGSVDTAFGSGGHLLLESDSNAAAEYASFDSEDRILIAMHDNNLPSTTVTTIEVARVSSSGILDSSFGNAGVSRIQFANASNYGNPIAPLELGAGGMIVVAYQKYLYCSSSGSGCSNYVGTAAAYFPAVGFATNQVESTSNSGLLLSGKAEPLATVSSRPGVYAFLIADYDHNTLHTGTVTTNGDAMTLNVAAPEPFPAFKFVSGQQIGVFGDGSILLGGYGPNQNPSTVQVAKLAGNAQLTPIIGVVISLPQAFDDSSSGGGSFEWLSLSILAMTSVLAKRRRYRQS